MYVHTLHTYHIPIFVCMYIQSLKPKLKSNKVLERARIVALNLAKKKFTKFLSSGEVVVIYE